MGPFISEKEDVQKKHVNKAQRNAAKADSTCVRMKGKAWIYDGEKDVKPRLLTMKCAGNVGHRGVDATWTTLDKVFIWPIWERTSGHFLSTFLLCVDIFKSGNKIPRPFCTTLHADNPKKVIHFDYPVLGENYSDENYALVVEDDLSGDILLESTTSEDY